LEISSRQQRNPTGLTATERPPTAGIGLVWGKRPTLQNLFEKKPGRMR
jgi:hypothetical protein